MKPDIKGLTKLAKVLERVPRKEFDMGEWWQKTSCGTVGCIAGWASKVFPSRFERQAYFKDEDTGEARYDVVHKASKSKAEYAFAQGFNISYDDAYDITLAGDINTPKQAAKKVMALVGRLTKEAKAK